MPPVALVIAAGEFAAIGGFTALAAGAAGAVTAGLALAGAALGTIGMISGNANLSRWGSIVGIVGGVSALGNALAASGTATAANELSMADLPNAGSGVDSGADAYAGLDHSTGTVNPAETLRAELANGGGANPAAASAASNPTPSLVDNSNALTSPTPDMTVGAVDSFTAPSDVSTAGQSLQAGSPAPQTPASSAQPQLAGTQPQTPVQAGTPAASGVAPTAGTPTTPGAAASPNEVFSGQLAQESGASSMDINAGRGAAGSNSPFDWMGDKIKGMLDYAKGNPAGGYMIAQALQGAADMASGKTSAQVAYYRALTGRTQYEIERDKQRRANLNAGYNTINYAVPVNPNANVQLPQGLINGNRG